MGTNQTSIRARWSTVLTDKARVAEQAIQLLRLMYRWEETVGQENHIRSIALYPPSTSRNGQWLVIGKAWSGGYKLVAFNRNTDPLSALLGFFTRWSQGKLDWKEDSFAER